MAAALVEDKIKNTTAKVDQAGGVVKARVVMMDSVVNTVKYPTGDNIRTAYGVTNTNADDERNVNVCVLGDVLVQAAGAISRGDYIYNYGTAGKVAAVPLGTTPSSNYYVIGIALSTVTLADSYVLMRIAQVPFPVAS